MIRFIPFEARHLAALKLRGELEFLRPIIDRPYYGKSLEIRDLAWSGLVADELVGCAGVIPLWRASAGAAIGGRAQAWTLFGRIPLRAWPKITQHVRNVLEIAHRHGYARIEAAVDPNFGAAVRWARRLGFVLETPEGMEGWSPDGRTFHLYARKAWRSG